MIDDLNPPIDTAAARSNARHAEFTPWARTKRVARAAPAWARANLPVAIMIGAWLGLFIWEATNTVLGVKRAFPDRGWLLVIGVGVGCVTGYMISYRQAAEAWREKRTYHGFGFSFVTLILFIATGFFVFSNFVGETRYTSQVATETNDDRQSLRDAIRRLDRELVAMPDPLSLEADKELLKSREAEAVGWGMTDLEPEGACKADLRARQRFLCNDAAMIRDDIIKGEALLRAKEAKRLEIEAKEREVETLQIAEAGQQYEAMSDMLDGAVSAEAFSTWALFFLTLGLLLAGAYLGDVLLERRERAQEAKEETV
jgi:hypothetical protein